MIKSVLIKFLIVVVFLTALFLVGWTQRDRIVVFLNDNFRDESHQVCMYVLARLADDAERVQLDGFCHIGIIAAVSQAEDRLTENE